MKNSKNKRAIILGVVLLGLLVVAYKVMLAPPSDTTSIDENIAASARVEAVLQQVESIKFDTDITQDPKFKSLRSIETPLISLPIGRKNPFSGI